MITRLRKPVSSAILCAALCYGTAAFAQSSNTSPAKAASAGAGDEYPDLIEIDPFGGVSLYGQVIRGLTMHTADGGLFGVRVAFNPSRYIGIELWADYANANIRFLSSSANYPAGSTPAALVGTPIPPLAFGSRNYTFGLNPVYNFTPRGSKVQPYLTAGVFGTQFTPTPLAENLQKQPTNILLYNASGLSDNLQVGFNYGGGVKWHLTDHFGLRFDMRGLTSRNPTFNLPNSPLVTSGVYIPAKATYNGLQASVGLIFYAGSTKCPPMPPPPPTPAPLPTPTISGMEGTICQGKPVTLHAAMSGGTERKLAYAWTLNGATQSSTTPDLTFTPNNAGSFSVQVTVTDTTPPPAPMERPKKFPVRCWVLPPPPPPVAPVTASATVVVNDAGPTISSVTSTPTELACAANTTGTHTANLSGTATAGACGGSLTYKWTVTEGSVANDSSPNATFDSSTLNFETGAQAQSKSVTATLTVTDANGKTATQTTALTVTCQPTFVRLDDVIFAKNNSRVNNCGKRLLIDDAASRMQSGDYDLVLVGHRETDEPTTAAPVRKGRKPAPEAGLLLDEQRVLNAAAVLSGGTGTCGKVDPARIKIDWVGTDQTSETRPGQCGTSATKATERKGSEVSEADKNRRVEVYLVPHNSTTMPPAVKAPKPLPDDTMKALGCPK